MGDGPRGLRRRGTRQEQKKRQTGGKEVPNRRKRGTLRAITRHGLSPVVKHTKEGSRNEGMLLMVIDTVKKGRKNSVQRRNSRKISYKFKLHIAYNRDKLRLQWSQS